MVKVEEKNEWFIPKKGRKNGIGLIESSINYQWIENKLQYLRITHYLLISCQKCESISVLNRYGIIIYIKNTAREIKSLISNALSVKLQNLQGFI